MPSHTLALGMIVSSSMIMVSATSFDMGGDGLAEVVQNRRQKIGMLSQKID